MQPDALCYNKVIAAYARARLPEVAHEWLDAMGPAGVPPSVVSYATAINGYAKTAQPEPAAALLREMGTRGLRPDTVALNGVLEAFARAQQPQQARAWLRRMEAGDELTAPPDVVSYTLVISALARQGALAEATVSYTHLTLPTILLV